MPKAKPIAIYYEMFIRDIDTDKYEIKTFHDNRPAYLGKYDFMPPGIRKESYRADHIYKTEIFKKKPAITQKIKDRDGYIQFKY